MSATSTNLLPSAASIAERSREAKQQRAGEQQVARQSWADKVRRLRLQLAQKIMRKIQERAGAWAGSGKDSEVVISFNLPHAVDHDGRPMPAHRCYFSGFDPAHPDAVVDHKWDGVPGVMLLQGPKNPKTNKPDPSLMPDGMTVVPVLTELVKPYGYHIRIHFLSGRADRYGRWLPPVVRLLVVWDLEAYDARMKELQLRNQERKERKSQGQSDRFREPGEEADGISLEDYHRQQAEARERRLASRPDQREQRQRQRQEQEQEQEQEPELDQEQEPELDQEQEPDQEGWQQQRKRKRAPLRRVAFRQ